MTREEAIEELNQLKHNLLAECKADIAVDMAIQTLSKDENVKGEWINEKRISYEYSSDNTAGTVTLVTWQCSVCGEETNIMSNYCPDCGADMRGEENVRITD